MQTAPRYRKNDRLERKRHGQVKAFLRKCMFIAVLIGIPCFIGGVIYLFFYSSLFTIQTIDIHVSKNLANDKIRSILYRQLDETVLSILPQRNIFMFDEKEARRRISGQILVSHMTIKRVFPHTISIDVEGKDFELLWYSNGAVWRVGSEGTIIGDVDQSTIASLPLDIMRKKYGSDILPIDPHIQKRASPPILLVDAKQRVVAVNDAVIDKGILESLLHLNEQSKKTGFDMAYAIYDSEQSMLTVVTKEGWEAYLALRSEMDSQFRNIATLLANSIKKDRSKLKYIDVRFDNRLYYTYL